jgi:uncharacterized protein (TIGR02996 family)
VEAVLSDERALIESILCRPNDSIAWLVYADWLEERGDARSEFIRTVIALSGTEMDAEAKSRLETRIRERRAEVDPRWLALLDRAAIELCEFRFKFNCPRTWERLGLTENESVRFCEHCSRHVFYCRSLKQARRLADRGECVALDPSIPRRMGDLRRARPSDDEGPRKTVQLGMGRVRRKTRRCHEEQ